MIYNILGRCPRKQCLRQRLVCCITLLRMQLRGAKVRKGAEGDGEAGKEQELP